MSLSDLNKWDESRVIDELARCCSSRNWVHQMIAARPFSSAAEFCSIGEKIWYELSESDWLEAFSGHPKIGDMNSLRAKFGGDHEASEKEQSGITEASEDTLRELSRLNQVYEERHGFIFIVCATGKSALGMLDLLRDRVNCSRYEELNTAAQEQWKITKLRLEALL